MNIMIFAAGKGTRLKPLTDILPKALVPVAGKPLLQRVVERVDGSGNTIAINIHHHAEQIRNWVETTRNHWKADIRLSDESSNLLETGGGIRKAAPLFTNAEPVLIHNCDILSNADLNALYAQAADADATLLVSERKTQRYLLFNQDMRLVGWTNIATGEVKSPYPEIAALSGYPAPANTTGNDTPAATTGDNTPAVLHQHELRMYAFSGIHVIGSTLLSDMDTWPEAFPIMDFYLSSCAKATIRGVLSTNLRLLDVGKLDTLAQAEEWL